MTLEVTVQFQLIAAGGVALLVGLSWALGFRGRARIDNLAPYATAHGVRVAEAAIDEDGRAGVALTDDGRLLLAQAMGLDVAVRVWDLHNIDHVRVTAHDVRIDFADFGFPAVRLRLSPAPLWLGRLAR